jgi:hypothetical protein
MISALSDAGQGCGASELGAGRVADQARPSVGPLMMQNSGPTGSSTRTLSQG